MTKVAAILGSWDTKHAEMRYMRSRLRESGVDSILIDFSTKPADASREECDVTASMLLAPLEAQWRDLAEAGRGAQIGFMAGVVRDYVLDLYTKGRIGGVISAGGLQNTTVAVAAMQALPPGFPKVVATTIASGRREFMSVVGDRDIVVVPALADLTGMNFVTRSTLNTACACLAGLIAGGGQIEAPDRPVVGVTLMGITNLGGVAAIDELDANGFEAVGFHATGTGGAVMEEFVQAGLIDGVLDMNLHEIVNEHFGGGYSYGAGNRLVGPIACGVPMLLAPGGLDFVDYMVAEFAPGLDGRKYVLHNGTLAHIKLTTQEATEVGAIVGSRIAAADEPIPMLVATRGLRAEGSPGESMSAPEVDEALVDAIVANAAGKVLVESVAMCLNTSEFGVLAAQRFVHRYSDRLGRRNHDAANLGSRS